MGWTKRQLITQAFEEIGLAAYVFDLTPEQLESALRRMDAMVGGWEAKGVRIAYPLSSSPASSDIDADSGIPDFAVEAVYLGLAVRLAAGFGKAVSPETKTYAHQAYNNMALRMEFPTPECQLPQTLPRGQGNKPWRNFGGPFFPAPADPLLVGPDSQLDLE